MGKIKSKQLKKEFVKTCSHYYRSIWYMFNITEVKFCDYYSARLCHLNHLTDNILVRVRACVSPHAVFNTCLMKSNMFLNIFFSFNQKGKNERNNVIRTLNVRWWYLKCWNEIFMNFKCINVLRLSCAHSHSNTPRHCVADRTPSYEEQNKWIPQQKNHLKSHEKSKIIILQL